MQRMAGVLALGLLLASLSATPASACGPNECCSQAWWKEIRTKQERELAALKKCSEEKPGEPRRKCLRERSGAVCRCNYRHHCELVEAFDERESADCKLTRVSQGALGTNCELGLTQYRPETCRSRADWRDVPCAF